MKFNNIKHIVASLFLTIGLVSCNNDDEGVGPVVPSIDFSGTFAD